MLADARESLLVAGLRFWLVAYLLVCCCIDLLAFCWLDD
jgi:hypothetical protein